MEEQYLDAFGGIATVSCGHCHHDIIEAIVNQSRLLQHTTVLYLNHVVIDFAEALAAKMPGELKGVGGVIELAPGGLFIADEAHGIVPDTVTMAKVRTLVF
ncbi:Alanine--glyoxylate aminotransferase 2, mitochondrial [Trifolium repens]|nr:Alanine--glyoxylate aminotransferase 2, mitochondrial [Trifolium repens]